MATSGYLHVNSWAMSGLDAAGASLVNLRNIRSQRFGAPVNAGTVTHIGFAVYKNGTPPAGNINLKIYEAASGGNIFHPVNSAANWTEIAVGSFDPGSIAATWLSATSFGWVEVAIDTPFFMDSQPTGKGRNDSQNAAHRYAVSWPNLAASCTDNSSNAIWLPFAANGNFGFGFQTRGVEFATTGNNKISDFLFYLGGQVSVSSYWMDKAAGHIVPSNISAAAVISNLIEQQTYRHATNFTAVGSQLTRARVDLSFFTGTPMNFYASIWDTNVTSDQPSTCIGTSNLLHINSVTGYSGDNIFNGVANSLHIAPSFVFSGGINVTSGTKYWLAVEVTSRGNTSTTGIGVRHVGKSGSKIVRWNANSAGVIFDTTSNTFLFETWYVDSETLNTFYSDIASPGGGGGPSSSTPSTGALWRQYPSTPKRRFPELLGRRYPL